MTDLAVKTENQIQLSEQDCKDKALEYMRNMGLQLAPQYQYQFLDLCGVYKLNPLKREIYAVQYGNKCNIIVGYEVYIKRAERTGLLDGWECRVEGTGEDMFAVLTIYRKDWKHPFTHYVAFREAVQRKLDGTVNSMWMKMPSFMLRKVAIAQGFRLCFPDELGGMPYTSDELPSEDDYDPIQREEPKLAPIHKVETNTEDVVIQLEQIVATYSDVLQGEPKKMVEDCIADNGDCVAMLERVKAYLGKKGIRI